MKGREILSTQCAPCPTPVEKLWNIIKCLPKKFFPGLSHIKRICGIIEAVAKHFKIPMDKVVVEIEDTANTSAATVIIALDRAIRDGRIQRGQNLLLTAFGAGITSGSILMRY